MLKITKPAKQSPETTKISSGNQKIGLKHNEKLTGQKLVENYKCQSKLARKYQYRSKLAGKYQRQSKLAGKNQHL
jgi:hypothetical protein